MTAAGTASSDDGSVEAPSSPAERVSNPYGVQVRRPTLNAQGKPSPPPERRIDLIQKVRVPEVKEQRRLPMPSREQLVQLALDTYKLALDNTKTYTNRRGAITTEPAPDYRAACDAIRVASQVAGYTLRGSEPRRAGVGEEDLDAEEALDKLRSKAAKKAMVGG